MGTGIARHGLEGHGNLMDWHATDCQDNSVNKGQSRAGKGTKQVMGGKDWNGMDKRCKGMT